MNCPICNRVMPVSSAIVCPTCWWKLDGKDRASLGSLHRLKNDLGVKAKIESIKSRKVAP